jgi:hypothetical protein
MVIYKIFYKNYDLRKGDFIGALLERRKDLRGKSRIESGLRWARLTFGQMVKDRHAIFVVPRETHLKNNPVAPVKKVIFTKEELWGMIKGVGQEIISKGDEVRSTVSSV